MTRQFHPHGPRSISVVVPTRDRPKLLTACLESLSKATAPTDELVVVDSASVDAGIQQIAEQYGARYLRCDVPGVGVARNAGWRAAVNDVVAFVDDDVRVDVEWADSVREVVSQHPDFGFYPGRVALPSGQEGARRPVAIKDDDRPARLGPSTMGDLGHSANLVVWRTALESVNGFDEMLGAGGPFRSAPEVDLFDRLFARGWEGRFSPEFSVSHEQWRQKRELIRLDWRYGFGAGARLAKLVRTDRRRAAGVARDFLWTWSGRDLIAGARRRDKLIVIGSLARIVGVAAGFLRAILVRLSDGHFQPRRGST